MKCNLCPRGCNADRINETGYCGVPDEILIARASVHPWEEPPISGTRGSGTVFFSGCNLGCVYCQNYEISHEAKGRAVTEERLGEIFRELAEKGVHNINLVNPTHYAHKIKSILSKEKPSVPVVYNSSGYERVSTLKGLEGLVDVYLPDLKYISPDRSEKYSGAADYFDFASKALLEMKRQCPENIFNEAGIMQKGMIVRHLVLPSCRKDSIRVLEELAKLLPVTDIKLSLMSQYTPDFAPKEYPELSRRITTFEYNSVLDKALELGFDGFFQEKESATKKYTPEF
jgi:putative pyruvate formate lyase activating enzyme